MNKAAVSMAADSTVTISSGRQGVKTFDTVNKLFELIKGRPIDLMLYANAELNGMPWETIVKAYREEYRGLTLSHLEDYVDHFSKFVCSSSDMLPPDSETRVVVDNAFNALVIVFSHVRENQKSCITKTGNIVMTRIRALIDEAITEYERALSSIPETAWATDLTMPQIVAKHRGAVRSLVDDLFREYRLAGTTKRRLVDLAFNYLTKNVSDRGATGIVFAGFGERDYLPRVCCADIRGFLMGKLLVEDEKKVEISRAYPGHLATFAQDEEARAYLTGITSNMRERIIDFWSKWVDDSEKEHLKLLDDKFSGLSQGDREAIAKEIHKAEHQKVREFMNHMNKHTVDRFVRPIWDSIGFLPKEELGIIAESLVNLTSFKQRINLANIQTVGGAIDVALISRGDGFIWLRRKQYFDLRLNPAWHLTHNGMVDVRGS